MKRTKDSNMLMHGFILVTILATAKSAEAEITMEAAFQGHCGHTSPCEQLCYEIHDGMYECDCIEGYELNKNGYSCQVINSTTNGDGHSKSDEDLLYQKGASFSAKLANDNEHDNQLSGGGYGSSSSLSSSSSISTSSGSDEENDEDADSWFKDDLERIISQHEDKVNSNDYYISSESISFSNNGKEEAEGPTNDSQNGAEFKGSVTLTATVNSKPPRRADQAKTAKLSSYVLGKSFVVDTQTKKDKTATVSTATTSTSLPPAMDGQLNTEAILNSNIEDDYYSKQDMSIYDDVNNNQLNLRPLGHQHNTYQGQNTPRYSATKSMSILRDNQNRMAGDVASPTTTVGAISAVAALNAVGKQAIILKNANISNSINSAGKISVGACNLDCGAEGLCDNSELSSRCLCPFGKTGNNCIEDIKVRVPKFSQRSWLAFPALRGAYKHVQIRVEFRPESFDGIILLSGERDDLTGDFMALLLNKGFVEFWFDCGSGVGSVRTSETILLNEWNSVIIYRHRWDAWLVLNHGTKVQGRSYGMFSRMTFREPVFLGGTGNITGLAKRLPVANGFVGCIRRFVANEHEYKFEDHPLGDVSKGFDIQDCVTDKCFKYPCQHGGKCLPSDQGALCLCPIGFVGDLCEIRMDLQVPAFNGSSFLRYAPLGDSALIWLELKIILKPEHADGLILYSGPEKHGDFIALSLNNGFVEFTFDLGSGPAVVRSEYPLSIGQWHTIKVSRTARLAVLKIDQSPEVMTISSNGFWHLSLPENLFLGGVNHVDKLPLDLKYKPFFVGCIQRIDINGHALAIISEALGGTNIGNCPHACVARPCGPLAECVPQMESYECRCSAFNAQCNKAAEVPLEELQQNKATRNKSKSYYTAKYEGKLTTTKKLHMKLHSKDRARYLHKLAATSSSTTSTTTTVPTTTTTAITKTTTNEDIEDDIIFRDVHGMHKKNGKEKEGAQRKNNNNNAKTQRNLENRNLRKRKPLQPQKFKGHHNHRSASTHHQTETLKLDPHHKHPVPIIEHKLSRLPTHYESFQTNPDSDILTFDDDIDLDELAGGDYKSLHALVEDKATENEQTNVGHDEEYDSDSGNYKSLHALVEDKATENEQTNVVHDEEYDDDDDDLTVLDAAAKVDDYKSNGFVMDEILFDANDGTEEYHRKQLVQDMRRIMANTRGPTQKRPQLELSVYEYSEAENDDTAGIAKNDGFNNDDNDDDDDDDDLLEPVQQQFKETIVNEQTQEQQQPQQLQQQQQMKQSPITTPQTHTDWSLLKKFELSADHQSRIGAVRKNFGACFAGTDSYFHYNDAETMSQIIAYNIDLNLRIKTHSHNGVILWTGRQGSTEEDEEEDGDYLSLGIEDGYLHFRYDLGSGEVDIRFNMTKVSDGLWHRVRAIRDSQQGYLEVDGRKSSTLHSPGKLRQLNTDTGLYVGGMPDVSYFTRRKYDGGIVGCISEIVLAGELKLNFDPNTLGTAHNVETGIL